MSESAQLTLDAGALLALERGQRRVRALLQRAVENHVAISIPAGVVAQSWRGGPRQARVARLLGDPTVDVVALDDLAARAVGLLCARSGHADVVDVHVALVARRRGATVVTSDQADIRQVDPSLRVIVV
ncbi:MAG: PIN domain nuclease [Actinomycetia bacterium]|nr:PIN domain nuclease [Actinomycetes bacterium]